MKSKLGILKHFIVLCSTAATTAIFGQTTFTWTGAIDGTNYGTAGNWSPASVPVGASPSGDTAQWDGVTTTNLVINCSTLPIVEFPSYVNFVLTANQTNSVQIISAVSSSQNLRVFGITNNSLNAAFILGATNTAYGLNLAASPAGATHYLVNNSSAPATINPNVKPTASGGVAYTLEFGGTGDWVANNYLVNINGPDMTIQVDGPGSLIWTPPAPFIWSAGFASPLIINGGAMVLKQSNLRLGSLAIINNAIFKFDAPAQILTLSGVISGSGRLIVTNGTLTLSGASIYSGNTILSGGELIVRGAESAGTSGPLGVGGKISFAGGTLGYSVSNAFDYSPRFSTAANQTFRIDTGGQNVTFATGLGSSGGSLTKTNSGTLTLTGTSSYSGLTSVSGGKLVFQGPKTGTGKITVADGAALGVTDTGTQITPNTLTLGTGFGCTLEFNNVTNTAAAPIAASTLSSAGTTTINLNRGTFTLGLSYPLFSWTSGSAPAVILGTVNGAGGNLSTNGQTILFNVSSVSPPKLDFTPTSGNSLQFTWPGYFKLQSQTDSLAAGLGTNWFDYPGGSASPVTVPVGATNGTVFFRLISIP